MRKASTIISMCSLHHLLVSVLLIKSYSSGQDSKAVKHRSTRIEPPVIKKII